MVIEHGLIHYRSGGRKIYVMRVTQAAFSSVRKTSLTQGVPVQVSGASILVVIFAYCLYIDHRGAAVTAFTIKGGCMFHKGRREQGFTLVEVIVVTIIVAVLAAFAVPLYMGYIKDSTIHVGNNIAGSISSAAATSTQQKIVFDVVNAASPPGTAAPLVLTFNSQYDPNVKNYLTVPNGYTVVWSDPNPGEAKGTGKVSVYFTEYGPSTARTYTYKQ
jgi:prepilin-type N-terminal cleavage/methylation domain-containing protein